MRLAYPKFAPEAYKALVGVSSAIGASGIDPKLLQLVYLRVSQINGCAFCTDLHARELRELGASEQMLDTLAAWRDSPAFTEKEKAVLLWAESLTHVSQTHANDADYAPIRQHCTDAELANLTFAIATINAFNRLAIGFSVEPKART